MEFVLGVVKSQLSPFSWKTILVLVLAVGALFFAFRLFGKFNTAPETVAELPPSVPTPEVQYQPEYPQEEVAQEAAEAAAAEAPQQDAEVAAANE